jgi:hypothetical protein
MQPWYPPTLQLVQDVAPGSKKRDKSALPYSCDRLHSGFADDFAGTLRICFPSHQSNTRNPSQTILHARREVAINVWYLPYYVSCHNDQPVRI